MKPYAIFLSLTDNYIHLFNALYNSAELFDIGEYAEFVVVHNGLPEAYIEAIAEKTKNLKTKVRFEKIKLVPGDEALGKVMTVKYYRYKLMAEVGKEYKSICFIDTDIFFASGIEDNFKIAAGTDLIVGVNDNVVRNYRCKKNSGTCPANAETKEPIFDHDIFDGKFICNTPTFINMNKYSEMFMDVFNHRRKLGMDHTWPFTGDLETMNIIFLKHGVKDKLLVLASHLWTGVHYSIYRVSTALKRWSPGSHVQISDKSYKNKFIFMSETCEHIRAFHGRDWTSDKSEKAVKDRYIPKLLGQMEGKFDGKERDRARAKRENIFNLIQAYFLYLTFHSFINFDDLHKICPLGFGRYEYMKKKEKELSNIIRSFEN